MPTYEYRCKNCGDNLEVFQSFSAKPLKKHDVCGGDLQKIFHSRGVVFKGSGWYATDSKAPTKSRSSSENGDKPVKTKSEKEKAGASAPKSSTSEPSSKEPPRKESTTD